MRKILLGAALTAATTLAVAPAASADPIGSGSASAFALTANLTDQGLIPPTPTASVEEPPFGDDENQTAVPLDVDPVTVAGVLTARAAVHQQSDLPSLLEQGPSQHEVEGPYNARAVGDVADLELIIDAVGEGVPLLEADAVRAEAVAVCRGGTVEYSASSEVLNLVIAGQDPLSGPLNDLVNQIADALEPLAPVVNIDTNVTTVTANGASVDALVVTVLEAAGDAPLVSLRIGHAEVGNVACGEGGGEAECSNGIDDDGDGLIDAADPECHTDGNPDNPDSFDPGGSEHPQCSNGTDDDGDGLVDAADPDCHTDGDPNDGDDSYNPNDGSESPAECNDGIDNDGFNDIDEADPQCHTDGDANNPDSYDANIPSEGPRNTNVGPGGGERTDGALPRTGAGIATGVAALMGAGALALHALRRRLA